METLLILNFKASLQIVLLFFAVLFIIAWVIVEVGKRNIASIKKYERIYKKIQRNIASIKKYERIYKKIQLILQWTPTEGSYYSLTVLLNELHQCKHQDSAMAEMTSVLQSEFDKKYEAIKKEIDSRDEFSAAAVLD